jgi:(3S)-linalool synthase
MYLNKSKRVVIWNGRIEYLLTILILKIIVSILLLTIIVRKLIHFTRSNMICRWNDEAADLLPRGIRSCYNAIYTSTNEIANMVEVEYGFNPVDYLKNSVC